MSVLVTSEEVREALDAVAGVVALETSVLSQGLPPPRNGEAVRRMTTAVREGGAVPAWIGIVGGEVRVGLTDAELEAFWGTVYNRLERRAAWILLLAGTAGVAGEDLVQGAVGAGLAAAALAAFGREEATAWRGRRLRAGALDHCADFGPRARRRGSVALDLRRLEIARLRHK